MRLLPIAALLVALSSPLAGQAPIVTPEGDPSVDDDTLYALAVDPADYPEEDVIVILDDGIVIQEADGTGRRTYRTVAQLLTREAVDSWAEHTFGYDGGREEFTLNWARVVGSDGEIISAEPLHQQVMDMPVPEQSPIYTDWKRVRVSLGGVEAGTIVDYSYTVVTKDPVMPGDFFTGWTITTGGTILRSRLIVDVPTDFGLRKEERDLAFEPKVRQVGDRMVYEWSTADLPWIEPEYFAARIASGMFQRVSVGGPNRWEDIGAWYADLARDRYRAGDDLAAAADEVVASFETRDAKLRELHRWIAQDFRYISISLGQGGFQPRPPDEVFLTLSGDCKDKATLFVTLARRLGYEAYPVLLSSSGGVDEDLPSVGQFDHAIAAVRGDEGWIFLDLTAELIPFGEISPGYQGEFGLVVFDDGAVEEVEFPDSGAEDNVQLVSLEGELFEDGSMTVRYVEAPTGVLQYSLRSGFAQEFTAREIDLITQGLAGRIVEGARGEDLEIFNGRDLTAIPRVAVTLNVRSAARKSRSGDYLLDLPIANFANPSLVTGLEDELPTRKMPIDVDGVSGLSTAVVRFVLTLPEGWEAELPLDVLADSPFGFYRATYAQEGRVLTIERTFQGRSGTQPREALQDLIDWLAAVAEDDVDLVILRPATVS